MFWGRSVWSLRPRLLTVSMSRSLLFLGGSVSTGARLRFTGHDQDAIPWSCGSRVFQPVANHGRFDGLGHEVHPKE